MPPRKSQLGWETMVLELVPPPAVFLVPWAKDKCVCTCACVCHPEGALGVLSGICSQGFPHVQAFLGPVFLIPGTLHS